MQKKMQNPNHNDSGRISVVRDRHLVPLLASMHEPGAKTQPWSGVLLERHAVVAGEIPEHEHPDLCLHLQINGADDFEWWSGGRNAVERTRPGSLILIPAGTTDRLHWEGRSERLILSVRQEKLAAFARETGGPVPPEFTANWTFQDPGLQLLISEMGREAQEKWPLGSLYADLLALGFQTQLLKKHALRPLRFSPLKGGLSLSKLRRAMEYIKGNLAVDVRLDAIAAELELSSSHFAHEFRNSTGQTPYQYLLDQRMTKAQELLKNTQWPVQNVAAVVGFNSPVNFIRAFRQRVGLSPAAWRRAL